jgi:hypothetical protein
MRALSHPADPGIRDSQLELSSPPSRPTCPARLPHRPAARTDQTGTGGRKPDPLVSVNRRTRNCAAEAATDSPDVRMHEYASKGVPPNRDAARISVVRIRWAISSSYDTMARSCGIAMPYKILAAAVALAAGAALAHLINGN